MAPFATQLNGGAITINSAQEPQTKHIVSTHADGWGVTSSFCIVCLFRGPMVVPLCHSDCCESDVSTVAMTPITARIHLVLLALLCAACESALMMCWFLPINGSSPPSEDGIDALTKIKVHRAGTVRCHLTTPKTNQPEPNNCHPLAVSQLSQL